MKALSKKQFVAYAEEQLEKPERLARLFLESVRQFEEYENEAQAFNATPPPVNAELRKATAVFAWELSRSRARALRYVSRELDCLRRSPGVPLSDGTPSKRAVVLDLLLVDPPDPTPILAEVKLRTDTNPLYGLVQVWTAAAHLSTPSQRRRIARHFPSANFATEGPLDAFVILFEPPQKALDLDLRRLASQLAERIKATGMTDPYIRRLGVLEATRTSRGISCLVDA